MLPRPEAADRRLPVGDQNAAGHHIDFDIKGAGIAEGVNTKTKMIKRQTPGW
jgi:transposase